MKARLSLALFHVADRLVMHQRTNNGSHFVKCGVQSIGRAGSVFGDATED